VSRRAKRAQRAAGAPNGGHGRGDRAGRPCVGPVRSSCGGLERDGAPGHNGQRRDSIGAPASGQGAMHPVTDDTLRLTHALRRPATAVAAARALRGNTSRAAIEALVEVIEDAPSAAAATAAIAALELVDAPIVVDALQRAVGSPRGSVRQAAIA